MIELFQAINGGKTDDYVDQIAQTLTVFCVSALDYQYLIKDQAEDARVGGCTFTFISA